MIILHCTAPLSRNPTPIPFLVLFTVFPFTFLSVVASDHLKKSAFLTTCPVHAAGVLCNGPWNPSTIISQTSLIGCFFTQVYIVLFLLSYIKNVFIT